ncbi:arsenosugar biosynthesis radical SAM (seleno)protein ArsS [Calycomorphotria hydatis]|uniref:Cyclic pyranopterin monophosphate synthase n=1 Tax=Calycomorphotria hydatis TaxID=2528027 RepID=A0A517TEM3_9PLAN|nr:arsenosugar biosynthesis radical SAM (seleno)protein ArsS [Calycomorphotria hydatis]QDT66819.1 Cyclic pyranopterin monophosphate synthase [Calycomorphotria hydatis]
MNLVQLKRPTTSLSQRKHELAAASRQLELLEADSVVPRFESTLAEHGQHPLLAGEVEILQVNVGKLCNMTCRHCHVDAGPDRREMMDRETADACLRVLEAGNIGTLDLTGGAPEMNPQFRYLVESASKLGCHVIDRCNLTILTLPKYEDMPQFLADHQVEIVASLPCYLEENTDQQRGDGTFSRSIEALRKLNSLGYGKSGSELKLTLVYNPVGYSLPPNQASLEAAYREQLLSRFGIEFSRLFTITNMPISRYLEDLISDGKYEEYMKKLVEAFNPAAVAGLMCRNTLSVGWDGRLYDCDFNQMLSLEVGSTIANNIRYLDHPITLAGRAILTGQHCYGCTAGAGSGCQGAINS